ncbi:uncharacterized protein LOC117121304 isoform X2 [Anneissia japonica]|nr:uncharacterized protein LOC117121304 isoform X2 [Anneissia japonica]
MDSGISRKECIILSSREGKSVLNEDDQLTTDAKLMLEEDGQLVLDDRGYAVSDEDVVSEGVKSILEKDSPSILKDVEIVIEEYNGNVASEEEDTGISEEDKKFRADEGKFIISKEDIKLISKKNVLEKANEDGQLMTKEDNLVISKEVGKIFREKDSCTVSAEVGKFISEDYGHVVSEEVDTIMLEENGNITSEKDCTFISEEDRKLMSKKALAISEVGKMQTKNYGCLVSGDVGKLMSEECGHTVPEGVSTIILGENGNVTSEKDGMNLISNKDDLGNVTSEKDGMNLISNKDDLNIALNKNSKLMSEKDVGKLVSEKDIYSVSEDVDTIMLEGNECITSEEYGNLTPEEEGLVTEDIGKLKTKEDSFGVLEEVGKLRLEENGNIVSEEKAISFEALHITLEDSSLLSEKINVSENRKQRVVEQSFEKNKHFENDVMEVGGHDLDWNADSNQHQVSSVNSSQETVTSADTFDFPVCSPLSRKWAMIESPDIKHDHPSQERFSDYTISDSGESEGGNVSQSSSFDDIIQNEEAEWKEICDIGQEPLRVSRKRTVTFQEDTDHVNWRIEPTDKNDSAKDSTISSVPAKKLHICSPFMNTEIYNTTVATISQVPPQTFNRYEVLFPVEEKVSATLPATTPHCSAFTMNDYKRNNKSGVLLLDVTSKKIDGYRWKGTKCSETAKRSLPLNNSHQPSSDCYNSTPEDERLIYQLDTGNQNDSLDNLESCLLQPASNVALCHSEPQLSMFKSPFMNKFSVCLHGNENFSSHCVQEDKLSYGCSRHNTDQSRNVVPLQKGSMSVSEFMENSIDKCTLIQHEGQCRNPIIDLDYNLNSEPLMINNTKAHYDVQPVNVSSHPMNDGTCEPYMKIPDSDSDFSYLSQNDDNLLYDVVDVSKYSRAAISEPLISEEEQGGGNKVHQRVPVDGRFALEQFEKCTPSFCQEVPSFSTVNIAIPNDKDTYDRHTGNSQLPLFSTEEDADKSLCNPSTHSRVVSHYFEYVGCDQENNQRAEIWKFSNNSSSRRYENNMDIGLSTRLRKPLISRPPDVEVQSNIRSLHMSMTTSETCLQERSGHLLGIDRTRNNAVCVLRQEKEDNVAATNLNETSRDITLTLDQSLTDELGEFFGSDVKEVFDTLYENSEKSLSVQEPTPTFTKIQTEMFESQENSEVHSQNTLYVSGETENHVKSLVQLEDCRNSTKLRVKEKTNSYGVERNRAIPCIRTVELVKKSEKKAFCSPLRSSQMFGSKLRFPSKEEVDGGPAPTRQAVIPVIFEGVKVYKETLTSAIREHLNILLFSLSQRYHQALSRVDISGLIPGSDGQKAGTDTGAPVCQHNTMAKMICVKKDGPNKGRFFYTCSQPRSSQCKFFLWADQYKPDKETEDCKTSSFAPKLSTAMQIRNYMKGLGLALHCRCQLIRKASGGFNQPNLPTWIKKYRKNLEDNVQKKLFLKLTYKEVSSTYAKDDLWVISSSLQFDPACSFIAKSIYHGPSSNMEIQIEPVSGYSPSNWTAGTVHSLLLVNASNELAQLANIEEHVTLNTVPILPYLMDSSYNPDNNRQMSSKAFKSPICSTPRLHTVPCTSHEIEMLANEFIDNYHLNADQAEALLQVASMFNSVDNSKRRALPITLIHGVFGAGKSFLLSVVVLFLVHLFTIKTDQLETSEDDYWKLLISSTTNVAVDRILMGLLDLGFEDFIRVGSLRKISKPILPYSVHASDKKNDDIKELQEMLKSDLTPSEKQLIKKSLERQRLGHNKALLAKVKVVAVTCAACAFPCIDKLKFPVVLLDECSQMTEPASLLPIAKFHSEKLVLVGDPKQLPPTIQGSEAATTYGLEQTLFGRLVIMGIEAVMLRTQYRCHPHISALSNQLFYDNQLVDGVNTEQRQQLM